MGLKSKRNWSLKSRLTIFMSVIFLTSICTLVFYANRMLYEDMEHISGEQQFAMVSFMAAQIDRELDTRLKALEKIASEINPAMLDNPASLQALLEQRPIFQGLFNDGVFATGSDGTAVAAVPVITGRVGAKYMDRDFISVPIAEGKSMIGQPVMDKKSAAPIFSMTVPILGTKGKAIGALVGMTNLHRSNFLDGLTKNRYGKTGGYLLVAPQYRLVITATDKRRVMTPVSAPGTNRMIDRFLQGYEGSGIAINSLGVEVLASAKRVPAAGWYVAVSLPTKEAFASIHKMKNRFLLISIFLTLFVCGVVWLVTRWLLSPLITSAAAISAMGDPGHAPQPLSIARDDEIGELIAGFNSLLTTLGQREEKLVRSEEKHRSILMAAVEGFCLGDSEGRILEVNEAFCKMTGYSEQELLSMRISDLDAKGSAGETGDHVRKIMMDGHDRFESRHRRKDGSIFDVRINVQYKPVDGGQFVLFSRDITERNQHVDTIRRSEYEFRMLAESMPQIVWIARPDGCIIYFNQQWADYTGLTLEESCGNGYNIPFHADDKQKARDAWQNATANGSSYLLECRLRRADGVYRWWLVRGVPVLDSDGAMLKWFGTCTDIDEIKQTQTELMAAKVAAESANRAKSEFLANMSHEIRTPMNGIMGMAQLLQRTEQSDEQKDYLDTMMSSSRILLSLIDEILDLSKIEQGRIELEHKEFSLRFSISDVIRIQSPFIHRKGLAVKTVIPAEVPDQLVGDQLRFKQVLLNLLSNAVKFTARGGVDISVSIAQLHGGDASLEIVMKDTGIGISAEALTKIFDPFVQADASITRHHGGTGLGLSICKRLAELMGGKVWAESREGVGSEFYLQIPLVVSEQPDRRSVAIPHHGKLTPLA